MDHYPVRCFLDLHCVLSVSLTPKASLFQVFEMSDESGCYSRAGYRAGLGVLRQAALKAGIPFW